MANKDCKENEILSELDKDLFSFRESVDLTPENARFFRSEGNLISLRLKNADGKEELFERVVPVRAFPLSEPDEFISIKEPESREQGNGAEIGFIRRLSDFDPETSALISEELQRRYFMPEITKIHSSKEKFGYRYFDVDTSAGRIGFAIVNAMSSIRTLENGSVLITDLDGNCFIIPDPSRLDKASYKKIEIFI